MSTKQIPVRIDEEQYDILAQIRKDIGTPVAESVRRAIHEYIERNYPVYLSTRSNGQKKAKSYMASLD